MCQDARLFHCARCRTQVLICRQCDRGQLYCSSICSQQARTDSLHRANHRYRTSRRGRMNNAARQQRFRQRQAKKVTHQGSIPLPRCAPLRRSPRSLMPSHFSEHRPRLLHTQRCCVCGQTCGAFLRLDFLRRGYRGYPRSDSQCVVNARTKQGDS